MIFMSVSKKSEHLSTIINLDMVCEVVPQQMTVILANGHIIHLNQAEYSIMMTLLKTFIHKIS